MLQYFKSVLVDIYIGFSIAMLFQYCIISVPTKEAGLYFTFKSIYPFAETPFSQFVTNKVIHVWEQQLKGKQIIILHVTKENEAVMRLIIADWLKSEIKAGIV